MCRPSWSPRSCASIHRLCAEDVEPKSCSAVMVLMNPSTMFLLAGGIGFEVVRSFLPLPPALLGVEVGRVINESLS